MVMMSFIVRPNTLVRKSTYMKNTGHQPNWNIGALDVKATNSFSRTRFSYVSQNIFFPPPSPLNNVVWKAVLPVSH